MIIFHIPKELAFLVTKKRHPSIFKRATAAMCYSTDEKFQLLFYLCKTVMN